ncbi:hypothetical protein CEV32_3589 [Brucella rhizosphaerae]|uniref:Uncharacterized protein n=1 Tax=Brucella rhizosphaerae TaxID=571254 RepID=A0A256FTD6_9HYPH|nr:hypothetical protein CEV32_3589 [Brucella rhizosphaerae]
MRKMCDMTGKIFLLQTKTRDITMPRVLQYLFECLIRRPSSLRPYMG